MKNDSLKDTIIKPITTEKVVAAEQQGKHTFLVKHSANKIMVRKAVEEIYGVKVKDVNIMPRRQKKVMRRYGKGIKGKKAKKAIVTLVKGESLKKSK
ncbi:MAG: 50S ribosomal protein L23 [Candidatus Moranbacteria bacterium]|nr:50S ribosomal protein L23 [Candidatus Moranbacteria bacterium]